MSAFSGVPVVPGQWVKGLVPTLNDTGFMFEVLDSYAREFIASAASSPFEALDIGCAYGVSTLPVLEQGAHITACDMDARHLRILEDRVPASQRHLLTVRTGTLPDIDLPEHHYGNLLCSRVLHFLPGEDIERSVQNMYRWLRPGGKLVLVADTPYGIWRKFIPDWKANVATGERWPGLIQEPVRYLPFSSSTDDTGPPLINLLSPELLRRTAVEAGFEVLRCSYIERTDFNQAGRSDGRENCGLVAIKPWGSA